MSVLIIDDAKVMRMVIKETLVRYCGYDKEDIHESDGGIQAISQYKQLKPDFVLCDISMPDINGLDMVKELIEIDPNAKIIMCTASAEKESVKACVRAGALDYITKPPTPERIKRAVKRATETETVEPEDEDEVVKPEATD